MLVSLVSSEVHKLFHIIVGFVYSSQENFFCFGKPFETFEWKVTAVWWAKPDSLNDLE